MSEFKGTPGPWLAKDVSICDFDKAGLQLAFLNTANEERRAEGFSNAKLIAAAPELLEALQAIVSTRPPSADTVELRVARAAIAKALGQ